MANKFEILNSDIQAAGRLIEQGFSQYALQRFNSLSLSLPLALYYRELSPAQYCDLISRLRLLGNCAANDPRLNP